MTIVESPQAEKQKETGKAKVEEVQSKLSEILEIVNTLEFLLTADKLKSEELEASSKGTKTGPWRTRSAAIEPPNKDSIFDYLNTGTTLNIFTTESLYLITSLKLNETFKNALYAVENDSGIKNLITQAQADLTNNNTGGYLLKLENVKKILKEEAYNIRQFYLIAEFVNEEINNSSSLLYKGEISYGPYTDQELANFRLPTELLELVDSAKNTESEFKNLIRLIDKLVNLSSDIDYRVLINNAGITQDSKDPNILNVDVIEEKDPWGIRFSYTRAMTGTTYLDEQGLLDKSRGNRTLTHDNQTREEVPVSEIPKDFEEKTVIQKRSFYFQLLPAIKSNLPVSSGTDVPGAMPGVQFRIENNIVKHRIPGFAPIYQPIGIDSIKCTLVGMFTGDDGVDISSGFSNAINTGLLNFGDKLKNTSGNNASNASNTPIPSESKSSTANPKAVLSEDAFQGAQDFYNEIVATGQEVEVELNLRKSDSSFTPSGTAGPFRDETTGNPKFKAFIKKLDLYYTRRDRCWFILDLEITNSGLISNKCINLTNIIDQAVDLFQEVQDDTLTTSLTKEALDACFTNPIKLIYKNSKSGYALVVDKNSGLSYEYRLETGELRSDEIYPTSMYETLTKLRAEIKNVSTPGIWREYTDVLTLIYDIIVNSTESVRTDPSNNTLTFAQNRLSIEGIATKYLYYSKNDGQFYERDKKGNLKKGRYKITDPKIRDAFYGYSNEEVFEAMRFFIDEYYPLVEFKTVTCDDKEFSGSSSKNDTNSNNNSGATNTSNNTNNNNSSNTNNSTKTTSSATSEKSNGSTSNNTTSTTTNTSSTNTSNTNNVNTATANINNTVNNNTSTNTSSTVDNNTTRVYFYNNEDKTEELNRISESFEKNYKNLIEQAVNEVFIILAGSNTNRTDILTPELITTLKNKYKDRSLYIKNDELIITSVVPESAKLEKSLSTNKELRGKFFYRVVNTVQAFRLISNNKEYKIGLLSTQGFLSNRFPATVKLQIRQGTILINSINLLN